MADGIWYSFATRTVGSPVHIQIASSLDFLNWSLVNNSDGSQMDALPSLPPWVDMNSPNTWGPDVSTLADGGYVMYFSATTNENSGMHCIGAAFSSQILGPYTPQNNPLVCPLAQGGAIDPAGYNDSGQMYIVYKIDGNSIGHGGACNNQVPPFVPTPIMLQPVANDGATFQGNATLLLDNNNTLDQGVVEAPSLVQAGSTYVLFFSSGCYMTGYYTVSYAVASSIAGPYTRAPQPLFQTGDFNLTAPGGASIARDAMHVVFHADFGNGRAMYEAIIEVGETNNGLTI